MVNFVISIFWNRDEKRLRSLWRLVMQTLLMIAVATGLVGTSLTFMPSLQSLAARPMGPELVNLLQVFMMLVPIVASVYLAGKYLDRRPFSEFGFQINRQWWTDFGFGLTLGAVLMTGIFLTEWACGWITIKGTFSGASAGTPFLASLAASLVLFICVGIQEELLTRGYQLTNLAEGFTGSPKTATFIAAVLSSVGFGLMHAGNPAASTMSTVNIMAAGMLLATGYMMTRQLAIPIGLHIAWNFFQGNIFGFPVSGNVIPPTVISIEQGGNPVVTGGAFGPEAGLIGLAAIAAGTAIIFAWVKWRQK